MAKRVHSWLVLAVLALPFLLSCVRGSQSNRLPAPEDGALEARVLDPGNQMFLCCAP